ncbi:MAG TPA: hypothetical protein DCY93_03845 [Firmicutes bacterium]|nr:hypothetical protein [Bacillota bacterium]
MVKKKRLTGVLLKELFRTLIKEWKQLFSIIAISFLSICLFSGLTANASNLEDRQNYLYEKTNYAPLYVTTSKYDSEDINALRGISGVKRIESRGYFMVEDIKTATKDESVNMIIADDITELSNPLITSGEDGVLVMNKYYESEKLNLGDELIFETNNFFLESLEPFKDRLGSSVKDGKENVLFNSSIRLTFKLRGTMYHPEGVQNAEFSSPVIYVRKSKLSQSLLSLVSENYEIDNNLINMALNVFLSQISNQYLLDTDDSEAVLEKIKEYYSQKENNNLIIAARNESLASSQALAQDVNQAKQLTIVFPLIFFLVSILVIMTTLSQMIIRQRNQIGCLKALGVKKSRIYFHYMCYGLILCLIGGIIGFFVGPLTIPNVLSIKYGLLWDIPKVNVKFFNPASILILFVMCLIAVVCSFFASHYIIKEKPVDTLRPKAPKVQKRESNPNSFLYKHTKLSTKMAYRNIKRNKGKSIMVIIGTLGCTALSVCGFGIVDTLNHCIDVDYSHNLKIELMVSGSKPKIEEYSEVEKIETVYSYPINIAYKSYVVSSLTMLEDNSTYFTPPYGEKGLTIDDSTAEKIGVKVGDEVKLNIGGNTINKKIGYVFKSSVLHGVFDLASDYSDDIKSNPTYYLYLKDGSSPAKLKDKLILDKTYTSVLTINDLRKKADNILSSIKMMTNVVKLFAILLCIVVIYNLTSLNISERSRDIATMKVLGFTYGEINSTLTKEIMFDTAIGTLFGTLLGYPMTVLVMAVNKTELLTFIYHVGWLSFLLAALISFFTALVVSLVLNLKSKRIKMVESLKSIE